MGEPFDKLVGSVGKIRIRASVSARDDPNWRSPYVVMESGEESLLLPRGQAELLAGLLAGRGATHPEGFRTFDYFEISAGQDDSGQTLMLVRAHDPRAGTTSIPRADLTEVGLLLLEAASAVAFVDGLDELA